MAALRVPAHRTGMKSTLRDSHHMIARYLASGMSHVEIAEVTGYSTARISTLAHDPSMIELVARYRAEIHEGWRDSMDAQTRYATGNMIKAERMLADKLDDAEEGGESLSVRELVAITSDRMDRFGYHKKSANLNINVDFAAKLEAAVARTRKVAAE